MSTGNLQIETGKLKLHFNFKTFVAMLIFKQHRRIVA